MCIVFMGPVLDHLILRIKSPIAFWHSFLEFLDSPNVGNEMNKKRIVLYYTSI